MDSKKNLEQEQVSMEGTPPWAVELFEKMKKEICAEVHAKVAYSMKVMLDNFKKDILSQLDDSSTSNNSNAGCYCKELKKCKACKEKKHALKAAQQLLKKEERKLLKSTKRKMSSSESDSDNEFQPFVRPKSMSASMSESKLMDKEQNRSTCSSSMISMLENLNLATSVSTREDQGAEEQAKIVNGSNRAIDPAVSTAGFITNAKEDVQKHAPADAAEVQGADAASVSQSSPSDSEFEVVSLPTNVNASTYYGAGIGEASASEFDDTSVSGHCSDAETETEFKDCKQSISEIGPRIPKNQSHQLDACAKTMTSSTSSAISGASFATVVGDSDLSGPEACATESSTSIPERERAPYSISTERVGKINRDEIINNQPMPSELLRERQPPSQAHSEPQPETTPKQPQTSDQTRTAPKPTPRLNSSYRVDNLPESLWDEALTVAAQTYNAARTAVENLADTFVPGMPTLDPRAGIPMPVPSVNPTGRPTVMMPLTAPERILYDMGFTDTIHNSQLLQRYNNDINRVIQALLGS